MDLETKLFIETKLTEILDNLCKKYNLDKYNVTRDSYVSENFYFLKPGSDVHKYRLRYFMRHMWFHKTKDTKYFDEDTLESFDLDWCFNKEPSLARFSESWDTETLQLEILRKYFMQKKFIH